MVALRTSALKVTNCSCGDCKRMFADLKTLQEVNYIDKDAEPPMVIISITGDPNSVIKVLEKKRKRIEHVEQSPPKNNPEMSIALPQAPVTGGINDRHMVPQLSGNKSTRTTRRDLDVADKTVDKTQLCCPKCTRELKLKSSVKPFACKGCKEYGFGSYRCEHCAYDYDYDLHKECRSPKRTISPEFFQGSTFKFCPQTSSTRARSCYACGNDIRGFFYHCKSKDLDLFLHPCCSHLKVKLDGMDFVHQRNMVSSSSKCMRCNKKMSLRNPGGCSYVSKSKKHFHVNCITQMVHEACEKEKGLIDESNDISKALGKRNSSRGSDGGGVIEILKAISPFLGWIVGILFGGPFGVVVPMLFDLFFLVFPKPLKKIK